MFMHVKAFVECVSVFFPVYEHTQMLPDVPQILSISRPPDALSVRPCVKVA